MTMGKPSKGTPADKRLKANQPKRASNAGTSGGGRPGVAGTRFGGSSTSRAFGGKKAAPFKRGGGRKK